jgi:trimethylamine:corrinoid methyltransferase-like protein
VRDAHSGRHPIAPCCPGWNEAGMHCSVAKFVVDAEQSAMGYRMAEGVR